MGGRENQFCATFFLSLGVFGVSGSIDGKYLKALVKQIAFLFGVCFTDI